MPPTVVRLAPAIPPFPAPVNGRDLNPLPGRRQRGSDRGGGRPHQGCLGDAESPSQTGLIKVIGLIRSFHGASAACPGLARAADVWCSNCWLTKSPVSPLVRGIAHPRSPWNLGKLYLPKCHPPVLHFFIHGGGRLPGFPATSANCHRKPRFPTGARKNPLPRVKPDEALVNSRKKRGSRGGFGACQSGFFGAASAKLPRALPLRPSPASDDWPQRFLPTPGPLGPLPWSS